MLPSRFKSPYQPPQGSYSLVSATCQLQSPVTRPPITPCRRDQVVSAGRNPLLGDNTDRFTWADPDSLQSDHRPGGPSKRMVAGTSWRRIEG